MTQGDSPEPEQRALSEQLRRPIGLAVAAGLLCAVFNGVVAALEPTAEQDVWADLFSYVAAAFALATFAIAVGAVVLLLWRLIR